MKRSYSDSSSLSSSSSSQSDGAYVREIAKAKFDAHTSRRKLISLKSRNSRREKEIERLQETQDVNLELTKLFAKAAAKKAQKNKEKKAKQAKKIKCEKDQKMTREEIENLPSGSTRTGRPFSRSRSENSTGHSDSSADRKLIFKLKLLFLTSNCT